MSHHSTRTVTQTRVTGENNVHPRWQEPEETNLVAIRVTVLVLWWDTRNKVILLLLLNIYLFIYLFIICKYTVAVFRHSRKGHQISIWMVWATMWLLGFELRTFGRAVSALNHWDISPAFLIFLRDMNTTAKTKKKIIEITRD